MNKLLILALASVLLISIILLIFSQLKEETFYYYTKAICNSSNFCQDYRVSCNGNAISTIQPLTGAAIQQPEDWNDTRNQTGLCS